MMRIDPHLLGPLTAEDAVSTGPDGLFRGAGRYLSKRQIAKTAALRDLVAARVEALLEPGEQVLYLLRAHQTPSFFDQMGFGAMAYAYHTVALVLTDRRMLEVMLGYNGKGLGTRTRSFAWGEVGSVGVGWRGLVLKSRAGKAHRFKVPVRGDRKVLGLLLPRVTERLLGVPSLQAAWPTWHCPECRAEIEPKAPGCEACGTRFKSRAAATWLSLAVPGGGLYYAGHPMLATLDLLGELFLFGLVAVNAAEASTPADMVGVYVLGAFFFVLTKLESMHLARVLVHRTKPVTDGAAAGWRRLAVGGAVASLAAILALPAARGLGVNRLDHDLAFGASGAQWEVTFDPEAFTLLPDDEDTRSEWTHADGSTLTVTAIPLDALSTFTSFQGDFDREMRRRGQQGVTSFANGRVEGFWATHRGTNDDGEPFVTVQAAVYDRDGRDVHLVLWPVPAKEEAQARRRLEALLAAAEFVSPRTPDPAGAPASAR